MLWITSGVAALVVQWFGVVLINVFGVEKLFGCDTFGTVLVMEDNFLQLFQWKILELVLDSNTIIHLLLLIIFYPLLYGPHYCQQFYCHLSVFFKRFISINYLQSKWVYHSLRSDKFHFHSKNQITIKINIKVKQNLSLCWAKSSPVRSLSVDSFPAQALNSTSVPITTTTTITQFTLIKMPPGSSTKPTESSLVSKVSSIIITNWKIPTPQIHGSISSKTPPSPSKISFIMTPIITKTNINHLSTSLTDTLSALTPSIPDSTLLYPMSLPWVLLLGCCFLSFSLNKIPAAKAESTGKKLPTNMSKATSKRKTRNSTISKIISSNSQPNDSLYWKSSNSFFSSIL